MNPLSDPEFLYHVLVAVGIGALVGLEREHHRDEVSVLAGVRTFALISLFGFVTGFLAYDDPVYAWLIIIGLPTIASFALFLAYLKQKMGGPGLTTPIAMLVTYFAGVMVGFNEIFFAVVIVIVVTFLLISRRRVHRFTKLLEDDEILGALQFLTLAVILFPLTAELNLEAPWDVFNPGEVLDLNFVLLLVVLVSAISFVSFIVIRKEGAKRGLEFSGLFGGMVNSEATTASICHLVEGRKDLFTSATIGILLSTGVMFVRNLIVLSISDPTLSASSYLVIPALLSTAACLALTLGLKSETPEDHHLEIKSPFAIVPALKFALLILGISAFTWAVDHYLGEYGIWIAAIGGFVSSAAVAASLGSLTYVGTVDPLIAAQTVMLACAFSCINKIIITRSANPELDRVARKRLWMVVGVASVGTVAIFLIALVL